MLLTKLLFLEKGVQLFFGVFHRARGPAPARELKITADVALFLVAHEINERLAALAGRADVVELALHAGVEVALAALAGVFMEDLVAQLDLRAAEITLALDHDFIFIPGMGKCKLKIRLPVAGSQGLKIWGADEKDAPYLCDMLDAAKTRSHLQARLISILPGHVFPVLLDLANNGCSISANQKQWKNKLSILL
jgi:hypothetical protein